MEAVRRAAGFTAFASALWVAPERIRPRPKKSIQATGHNRYLPGRGQGSRIIRVKDKRQRKHGSRDSDYALERSAS